MVGKISLETGSKCRERVDSRCGTRRMCCVSDEDVVVEEEAGGADVVAVAGALRLVCACEAVRWCIAAEVVLAGAAVADAGGARVASPEALLELSVELDPPLFNAPP